MFRIPFHVISCSYEANPLDAVGAIRVPSDRRDGLLAQLAARKLDAVLLSTCERTELYWWGEASLADWFVTEVLQHDQSTGMRVPWNLERADADLAVRHLLAVTAGVRSRRYGEPETVAEVRRAWTDARMSGTSHGELDALFRQAVDSARQIRLAIGAYASPALGDGIARELRRLQRLLQGRETRIAIIGAGELARLVLDALRDAPRDTEEEPSPNAGTVSQRAEVLAPIRIQLVNRTDARAVALAMRYRSQFDVAVCPWTDLARVLMEADLVVFALQRSTPLVGRGAVLDLPARAVPASWIDCAVPAVVTPDFVDMHVRRLGLEDFIDEPSPPAFAERTRLAWDALQQGMEAASDALRRLYYAPVLGEVEAKAVALAREHAAAPPEELARRLTRFISRELSTY